jgi:hydrogenase maturation protease
MGGRLPGARDKIVVIGYGNSLRTDDGVGPRVATAVALWELPGLVSIAVHQLTPELVELLALAELAIFVDARLASSRETVEILPLEFSAERGIYGHDCDPRSLLALARAMHGRTPRSWLVTVPATNFSLGEGLSRTASHGAEQALERIAVLVGAIRRVSVF